MDPMEAIRATFFQECDELLGDLEAGLLALQGGEAGGDTVNAVFRAVHSIKGGAGAFGHNALLTFAHAFENVLERVRGGEIAATAALGQQLLTAFDTLADHVAAAMGKGDIPQDGPALAGLNALLEGGAPEEASSAPAPEPEPEPAAPTAAEADEMGFVPVAVALEDFDAPAPPPALAGDAGGLPAGAGRHASPGDALRP